MARTANKDRKKLVFLSMEEAEQALQADQDLKGKKLVPYKILAPETLPKVAYVLGQQNSNALYHFFLELGGQILSMNRKRNILDKEDALQTLLKLPRDEQNELLGRLRQEMKRKNKQPAHV